MTGACTAEAVPNMAGKESEKLVVPLASGPTCAAMMAKAPMTKAAGMRSTQRTTVRTMAQPQDLHPDARLAGPNVMRRWRKDAFK